MDHRTSPSPATGAEAHAGGEGGHEGRAREDEGRGEEGPLLHEDQALRLPRSVAAGAGRQGPAWRGRGFPRRRALGGRGAQAAGSRELSEFHRDSTCCPLPGPGPLPLPPLHPTPSSPHCARSGHRPMGPEARCSEGHVLSRDIGASPLARRFGVIPEFRVSLRGSRPTVSSCAVLAASHGPRTRLCTDV